MKVSNRKKNRRKKAFLAQQKQIRTIWGKMCPNNCGEPGPHFIPPGFGSPGMFMCKPLENTDETD